MNKKKVILLSMMAIVASVAFLAGQYSNVEADSRNETVESLNTLVSRYYDDNATYTKHTKIYLNEEASEQLLINLLAL